MTGQVFGAVDIGASGGRVMAGTVASDGRVELEPVHRFPNGAELRDGHLRWDLSAMYEQVLVGLTELGRRHPAVTSIGIDTWAIDYGLLDDGGRLIAEPISYRDSRTDTVRAAVPAAELYAINGLQDLPFTTIHQLAAEPLLARARHALLIPDLLAHRLTGELRTEITNASTTGLLDARQRAFSAPLLAALGLPADLFPPLVEPGETIGRLLPDVAARTGLPPTTEVVAVGSHDTASAVVGVPASGPDVAYVSSGTWSLVGIELNEPILSAAAQAADFTNEGGVDGRIRFLRNVGGLWLLQESLRTWRERDEPAGQDDLLARAAALPPGGPTVDVDDPRFIAPGDMPARIRQAARSGSLPDGAAVVRCILDSLAVAYARTVEQAVELSGRPVDVIHIVGGGSQNPLLGQLTADLSGRPVVAGPVEATALGNMLVQARAAGVLSGDLDALRAALAGRLDLRTYRPALHVARR